MPEAFHYRVLSLVEGALTRFVRRSRGTRLIATAIVALALVVVWIVVYASGGTHTAYLHAAYLPISFAAMALGTLGGVVTALAAGVALGPLMPLNVETGLAQPWQSWLYRGAFFVGLAVLLGAAFGLLRARVHRNRALRDALVRVHARNLHLFAALVEERDEQTAGHCERVARNAVAMGRRLGLGERELGRLYWAGMLHDLGKIGVEERILRKPGPLTDEEYASMQRHCRMGRDVLLRISGAFEPIAEGVMSHHERWDGNGYPQGSSGERIPLSGRILAIADVYEAVTSHRPYRGPMSPQEARALIEEGRGTAFDPALVDVFLQAVDAGEIELEAYVGKPEEAFEDAVALILEVPDDALLGGDGADTVHDGATRCRQTV